MNSFCFEKTVFDFCQLFFRLVNWILKMNEDGFKVQEKQIIEAVKLFHDRSEGINRNDSNHSKPGKAWYKNFLKRYPAAQHNLSVNHKKAESLIVSGQKTLSYRIVGSTLATCNFRYF